MDTQERERLLSTGQWRAWIEAEARTWMFTPYQHKGRIKGVGVDCGGLVYCVYEPLFGPFKPFPQDYAPDWAVHHENPLYLDFIMPYVKQVPNPVPGGLSIFKIARSFGHAGIYTSRGTYINAWGRNGVGNVMEHKPGFFRVGRQEGGSGKLREVKHFDVSERLCKS